MDYIYLDSIIKFKVSSVGLIQEILILFILISILLFIRVKNITYYISLFLIFLYYIIFVLQLLSVNITGEVLNVASFANANQMFLLINSTMIINLFIFTLLFSFIVRVSTYLKSVQLSENIIFILVILFLYKELLSYKHSLDKPTTFMPASNFYNTSKLYYNLNRVSVKEINVYDKSIAKKFNIDLDDKKLKPFEKDYIYKKSLKSINISIKKPNIIVLYIESLSARLLSPYNKSMRDVTKNIEDFANYSMVVKGYYNHATPTAPGLYGQHCSLYPTLTYDDFNRDINPLKLLDLNCYPKYFAKNGYKTIYLSHSRNIYSHIGRNLALYGYRDIFLWKDLVKKFLPKEEELVFGETGLSDHQMMRALVNYLESIKDSKKPFLLGLSTIETHVGFEPNSIDGLKYKDGKSNTLNMLYNFDNAFGKFWSYFKNSKFAENTIVVLTGDHALYPNVDYKNISSDRYIPSVYDKLSLIIYDPMHKQPSYLYVNSSSVDLAPTLAALVGLNSREKNSFIGNSIFDNKDNNSSFGISAYPDFNFYMKNGSHYINSKSKYISDKNITEEYKSLKKLMYYILYLQKIDRF